MSSSKDGPLVRSSVRSFVDQLSSRTATPGGGSASALVATLVCHCMSLYVTVCHCTSLYVILQCHCTTSQYNITVRHPACVTVQHHCTSSCTCHCATSLYVILHVSLCNITVRHPARVTVQHHCTLSCTYHCTTSLYNISLRRLACNISLLPLFPSHPPSSDWHLLAPNLITCCTHVLVHFDHCICLCQYCFSCNSLCAGGVPRDDGGVDDVWLAEVRRTGWHDEEYHCTTLQQHPDTVSSCGC